MKSFKYLSLAAVLALSSAAAQAEGYAGVLLEMSRFNIGGECADMGITSATGKCDKKASGVKVYAGTTLSENWNLEAAYIKFGKSNSSLGTAAVNTEVSTLLVAAVVKSSPIPTLTLSGKVGISATTAKMSGLGDSVEEQHPALYLGASVDCEVYKGVKAVAAIDFTTAQVAGTKFGVTGYAVGAQMAF